MVPANSSWPPILVERLTIDHIGRLGDGVATAGPVYVPYTLPGETVEVEPWPGHPDRAHLLRVETASPERVAPICPHFGFWPAPGVHPFGADLAG